MQSPQYPILAKLPRVTLSVAFFVAPAIAFAQSSAPSTYNLIAPLPGLSTGVTLEGYLTGIFKVVIGISGVLAVVMIVWCGIKLMATGSVSGKSEAKKCIWNAIFGVLLALGAWLILNTINPQLVGSNLSLVDIPGTTTGTSPGTDPFSGVTFHMSQPTMTTQSTAGTVTIVVTRPIGTDAATVNYMTQPISAIPGVDYTPVTGTLNFAPGQTSLTITIPILNNLQGGGTTSSFLVSIVSPTGGVLGSDFSTTVSIINPNPPPTPGTPPGPAPLPVCSAPGAPLPPLCAPIIPPLAPLPPKPGSKPGCSATPSPSPTPTGPVTIPNSCFGRSVVYRDWTTAARGDGTFGNDPREPDILWFGDRPGRAHIIRFKPDDAIYNGDISATFDMGADSFGFLSTLPCDFSTVVKTNTVVAAAHGNAGTDFVFTVAPQSVYDQIVAAKAAQPVFPRPANPIRVYPIRLDPNRYYYYNQLDDASAYDTFGPSADFNSPPINMNPPSSCDALAHPGYGGVDGLCSYLRFDALISWRYYSYLDGTPLTNHDIPGFTGVASTAPSPSTSPSPLPAACTTTSSAAPLPPKPTPRPTPNLACTANSSSPSSAQLPIPKACFGRSVIAVRNWDTTSKGDGTYFASQAPLNLGFTRGNDTAHIIEFKTDSEIYRGGISGGGDVAWSTGFISEKPCDWSTIVRYPTMSGPYSSYSNYPMVNSSISGAKFDFVVAPASVYAQMQAAKVTSAEYMPRLEPNRYYYFTLLDDVGAYDMFPKTNAGNPDYMAAPNPDPPHNCTGSGCAYYLRFDDLFKFHYFNPLDGTPLLGNAIPGYTGTSFTPTPPSSGSCPSPSAPGLGTPALPPKPGASPSPGSPGPGLTPPSGPAPSPGGLCPPPFPWYVNGQTVSSAAAAVQANGGFCVDITTTNGTLCADANDSASPPASAFGPCGPGTAGSAPSPSPTSTPTPPSGGLPPNPSPAPLPLPIPSPPVITYPTKGGTVIGKLLTGLGTGWKAGDYVALYVDDQPTTPIAVQSNRTWSYAGTLAYGVHTAYGVELDATTGKLSASSTPITFTIVPPAPTVTSPANGATLTSTSLSVSGTGSEAGNTIAVTIDGAAAGSVTIPASLNWSFSTTVSSGNHTISAKEIDVPSGVSSAASSVSVSVSLAPPTASLTANGAHDITVAAGSAISYAWSSSGATSWSASYTSTCGVGGVWTDANGSSGGSQTDVAPSTPSCAYTITYSVSGSGGSASDAVTVHIP